MLYHVLFSQPAGLYPPRFISLGLRLPSRHDSFWNARLYTPSCFYASAKLLNFYNEIFYYTARTLLIIVP
jgi:hypothetical protein